MNLTAKVKLSTRVDPQLLKQVRDIASDEGRTLQGVIEEALRSLVDERRQSQPRARSEFDCARLDAWLREHTRR